MKKNGNILETKTTKDVTWSCFFPPINTCFVLTVLFFQLFGTMGPPHNLEVLGALWYARVRWEETERPGALEGIHGQFLELKHLGLERNYIIERGWYELFNERSKTGFCWLICVWRIACKVDSTTSTNIPECCGLTKRIHQLHDIRWFFEGLFYKQQINSIFLFFWFCQLCR